ncbi:MAG TPA: hypothetical protein ENH91_10415 [Leeuwenhoekiella sp.]|nr:hypothetical protein [Leeuwenhoekiella sp.]
MLIFLDIDGVMVPANSWRKPEFLEDGFPAFSKGAVAALNKIITASGADLVLITSHKAKYSIEEWENMFKRRSIQVNKITTLPNNNDYLNRKDELLKWFVAEEIKGNFIIIDDDKSLNGLPDFFKRKLIQTSALVGLTDYLADVALTIIEQSKSGIASK